MKVALYTRSNNPSAGNLIEIFDRLGLDFILNPLTTADCSVALSYGGDGTFLSSIRKMGHAKIPILGINSGRLGFLATVDCQNVESALCEIIAGRYSIERRMMVGVEGYLQGCELHDAVNEFTIQKRSTAMISLDVEIQGQRVANYWADGVIVSSPTGSTAYSMSVGGAILTPGCHCMVISPIAPHNLNIRPLVVADSCRIKIEAQSRHGDALVATIDNRQYEIPSGSSFMLSRSETELEIIKLPESSFYKTLRDKLLWGVDPRN